MKKFIAGVFILASVSLAAQSKKQIRDLKIKTMTETTTSYKDGKENGTYKSEYKTFDKDGNTLTDITYNSDGSIKRKETDTYSGNDKTSEIIEHPNGNTDDGDNSDPKKYKKTTWKYNANGDKIEEDEYDASGALLKKTTTAYNTTGDKMFEIEYDASGNILKKVAYGYDAKGLRTERKTFGTGGTVMEKHEVYTYTY
ncbi:MAG TPA: hypothetical protein VL651_12160 [Bacteroidia bacterium]|jgi:hypothetical protein|nr:hypothetical protein [Bacteroidia bacterium]